MSRNTLIYHGTQNKTSWPVPGPTGAPGTPGADGADGTLVQRARFHYYDEDNSLGSQLPLKNLNGYDTTVTNCNLQNLCATPYKMAFKNTTFTKEDISLICVKANIKDWISYSTIYPCYLALIIYTTNYTSPRTFKAVAYFEFNSDVDGNELNIETPCHVLRDLSGNLLNSITFNAKDFVGVSMLKMYNINNYAVFDETDTVSSYYARPNGSQISFRSGIYYVSTLHSWFVFKKN